MALKAGRVGVRPDQVDEFGVITAGGGGDDPIVYTTGEKTGDDAKWSALLTALRTAIGDNPYDTILQALKEGKEVKLAVLFVSSSYTRNYFMNINAVYTGSSPELMFSYNAYSATYMDIVLGRFHNKDNNTKVYKHHLANVTDVATYTITDLLAEYPFVSSPGSNYTFEMQLIIK